MKDKVTTLLDHIKTGKNSIPMINLNISLLIPSFLNNKYFPSSRYSSNKECH